MIDKFYTKPELAEYLITTIKKDYDLIIEPSAGNGSFSILLKCEAYDIEPEDDNIKQQDFLQLNKEKGNILTIGNPPFGKNCSLAIKFFNHAAEFSQTIAFILPLSFRKQSIQNKLDLNFNLVYEEILEPNSFFYESNSYIVPCVWQIWERGDLRERKEKIQVVGLDFCKDGKYAIRRVGFYSGKIEERKDQSESSWYFFNASDEVLEKMKNIKWEFNNSVGPRSISQEEIKSKLII